MVRSRCVLRDLRPDATRYWRPAAALVAVAAVVVYTLWGIITAPFWKYPPGVDAIGHMTKVWYLARQWKSLNFSDWFPCWYNGSTVIQYYPPLSIWVGAVLQLLTNNLMATFVIMSGGCILLAGWSAAALARRFGGWGAGVVAGVLYATGPYTLFTVFVDGTLGRAVSLPLYPWLMGVTVDLVEKPDRRSWFLGCTLVTLLILAHAMHAYLLMVGILLFSLVLALQTGRPWERFGLVFLQVLVGGMMSAFWALPGATQLETPGVPYAPAERLAASSVNWRVITGDPRYAYFGLALFTLAVLGTILSWLARKDRWRIAALGAAFLIPMSLIYGPSNPLYALLPMGSSLAPQRFMNAAYLPAAILAGLVVPAALKLMAKPGARGRKGHPPRWLLAGGVFVLVVVGMGDSAAYRRLTVHPASYPLVDAMAGMVPRSMGDPFAAGRLAVALPSRGAEQAFFPVVSGLNCVAGWNLEGTPHLKTFHEHNLMLANHLPEYVVRTWLRWNARSALVENDMRELMQALQRVGWRRVASHEGVSLLLDPDPPSYFFRLNTAGVVVGRSSAWVCSLFPGLTEGQYPGPTAYDRTYLDQFGLVFLCDIPRVATPQLEDLVRDLLRSGKRVVVDLSRSDISVLFDVYAVETAASGTVTLAPGPQSPFAAPVTLTMEQWSGVTYQGLDEEWLMWPGGEKDGDPAAVAGVRHLPEGPLHFVGLHLPRLPGTANRAVVTSILAAVLGVSDPQGGLKPVPFPVEASRWDGRGVEFSYSSASPAPTVVSVTWTPRWRARVDGQQVRVYRHENLVLLLLPAGAHRVQLRYGPTWVTWAGWAGTLLGVILLFLIPALTPALGRPARRGMLPGDGAAAPGGPGSLSR